MSGARASCSMESSHASHCCVTARHRDPLGGPRRLELHDDAPHHAIHAPPTPQLLPCCASKAYHAAPRPVAARANVVPAQFAAAYRRLACVGGAVHAVRCWACYGHAATACNSTIDPVPAQAPEHATFCARSAVARTRCGVWGMLACATEIHPSGVTPDARWPLEIALLGTKNDRLPSAFLTSVQ